LWLEGMKEAWEEKPGWEELFHVKEEAPGDSQV
jgi:hypothetical protein